MLEHAKNIFTAFLSSKMPQQSALQMASKLRRLFNLKSLYGSGRLSFHKKLPGSKILADGIRASMNQSHIL